MGDSVSCIICGKSSADGICIRGKYICAECEKAIANTDIYNDRYDEYKELIKKNIYNDMN